MLGFWGGVQRLRFRGERMEGLGAGAGVSGTLNQGTKGEALLRDLGGYLGVT